MHEMLIAIFDTEEVATKGLQALRDLHRDGGISLYGSALIVKDSTGKIRISEQHGTQSLGTALGLFTGGIVGLLGGPGGSAIGASIGAYLGLLADCAHAGIDLKFLEESAKALSTGKAAVVAGIEENWVLVVEPRLREHGGLVFRRFRSDVVADLLLQESKALQQELEALEGQLDRSNAATMTAAASRTREVKKQLEAIEKRGRGRDRSQEGGNRPEGAGASRTRPNGRGRCQDPDQKTDRRGAGGFPGAFEEAQSSVGLGEGGNWSCRRLSPLDIPLPDSPRGLHNLYENLDRFIEKMEAAMSKAVIVLTLVVTACRACRAVVGCLRQSLFPG
jgi:uncharacterized membrane protein